MIYIGIGNHKTPNEIIHIMTEIGMNLACDHILRSRGNIGADKAFEEGCILCNGSIEICIPSQLITGKDLTTLADAIICWTPDSAHIGTTGQILNIISNSNEYKYVIPVINLANAELRELIINNVLKENNFINIINTLKGLLHDKKLKRDSK